MSFVLARAVCSLQKCSNALYVTNMVQWIGFHIIVLILLAIDLGLYRKREMKKKLRSSRVLQES